MASEALRSIALPSAAWTARFSLLLLDRFNRRKRTVTGKWHIGATHQRLRPLDMPLPRHRQRRRHTVKFSASNHFDGRNRQLGSCVGSGASIVIQTTRWTEMQKTPISLTSHLAVRSRSGVASVKPLELVVPENVKILYY